MLDTLELAVTAAGRGTRTGVRGELREAVRVGRVLERVIDIDEGEEVFVLCLFSWKPARWSRTDCP